MYVCKCVCMYVCMCIIVNMLVKTIFNNKCCSIMNISQDNTVCLRSTFELRSAMLAESRCRTPSQLVTWRPAHEVFSLTWTVLVQYNQASPNISWGGDQYAHCLRKTTQPKRNWKRASSGKWSSFFELFPLYNFKWNTTFRKPAVLPSSGKGKHLNWWSP